MTENKILLSILIPTVVGREDALNNGFFKTTKENIFHGYTSGAMEIYLNEYEIILLKDNKEITIGEKREQLYKRANGLYSIQVDDDDELAPNAIQLILEAIRSNPDVDVISFEEFIDIDGKIMKSNHSNSYPCWKGDGSKLLEDGYHFHRTIFFKDVIRTELAKSVPVVHCRFGEDNMYADALKPFIQSEIHINQEIYKYIHRSSSHNERYGIKD